ncbi:putative acetyltransferase [Pustulibacterium marinum]|uniref:Putative acetyltransferase n=1 Tax=Pustulibacterium marinum TaxID=1224947 RepID=A0A1I7IK94_9FLAO|nr:GNAT family N-acetyltransferase [Pustulibacterium marinum]SFU73308.1 putative acetyltransferase [Pustulibacterium marinum]
MKIREIQPKDNEAVAALIRAVFDELEIPKVGTAYEDEALNHMFEAYEIDRACYFVVEENGELLGGAGVGPLANEAAEYCELQKMYFSPKARGKGVGLEMMKTCLQKAKDYGFEFCYIETMPFMHAAQKLYKKAGFEYLDAPMGCTGHTSCPVWMLKKLS